MPLGVRGGTHGGSGSEAQLSRRDGASPGVVNGFRRPASTEWRAEVGRGRRNRRNRSWRERGATADGGDPSITGIFATADGADCASLDEPVRGTVRAQVLLPFEGHHRGDWRGAAGLGHHGGDRRGAAGRAVLLIHAAAQPGQAGDSYQASPSEWAAALRRAGAAHVEDDAHRAGDSTPPRPSRPSGRPNATPRARACSFPSYGQPPDVPVPAGGVRLAAVRWAPRGKPVGGRDPSLVGPAAWSRAVHRGEICNSSDRGVAGWPEAKLPGAELPAQGALAGWGDEAARPRCRGSPGSAGRSGCRGSPSRAAHSLFATTGPSRAGVAVTSVPSEVTVTVPLAPVPSTCAPPAASASRTRCVGWP